MKGDNPLFRLQSLQRDLVAFSEARLPNVERLSNELESSAEDLRRLLGKNKKNESSRRVLAPNASAGSEALKIGDVEYEVNEEFRQYAIKVADELDLDELEAAKLCLDVTLDVTAGVDLTLPDRAVLRFTQQRCAVLECMRLVLQLHEDVDEIDDPHFKEVYERLMSQVLATSQSNVPETASKLFKACKDGLVEVETFIRRCAEAKQTRIMTGSISASDLAGSTVAQQLLLVRQHESLAGILALLLNGRLDLEPPDYRELISHAASVELTSDIAVHYIPILIASAARFGSSEQTSRDTAVQLHKLFEAGPAQLHWKMSDLKAVATAAWVAEYSHRFQDPTSDTTLRVADRQKAEGDRSELFIQAVDNRVFHFMLAACKWLKPELWHDPAKVGLVEFLLADERSIFREASAPSAEFVALAMRELQAFTDAFVSNMPDVVRRLKVEEDDKRRMKFSIASSEPSGYQPDLERFMLVMAYAYQDSPETAQEFLRDRETNLSGFLRWVSQRLPTPRVAALCELLTSISSDEGSSNMVHRFLLEGTTMVSGKLRKTYGVSWSQIFAELETYAASLRNRPALPQLASQEGAVASRDHIEGVETGIMLEAYLRLAAHVCRRSPEARNWLLREQSFHIGEVMFQMASSSIEGRLQASCFNMLAAMLESKVTEVNDGMWVMLDEWISTGGPAGVNAARPVAPGKALPSERHYLQRFGERPETATALVSLLKGLVMPPASQGVPFLDMLPFPENLGAAHRHTGIDAYVDFAIGTVFRQSNDYLRGGAEIDEINVLRYTCLDFVFQVLSTFNEDLLVLANATNIEVDATMRTSSLSTYARLHPFARVMEWLFNNNVISALFIAARQDVVQIDSCGFGTPLVQSTLRSIQVMNLAFELQATYFNIVRLIVKTQSGSRGAQVANPAFASFDDVMQSHISAAVDIAGYTTSVHAALSLESIRLLQKLVSSRKISGVSDLGPLRARAGNRLISAFGDESDILASDLLPTFVISARDVEEGEPNLKIIKVKAILDMLNASLDASCGRPSLGHSLLGFSCGERTVHIAPDSIFARGDSLFHAVTYLSAFIPTVIPPSNISWLLAVKRGCLDVVNKLALTPLTTGLVRPELLHSELLDALSAGLAPADAYPLFDDRQCFETDVLLETSADAVRDFLKVRELFFRYAAHQLRSAEEQDAFSVQESTTSTLRGIIRLQTGDIQKTMSVFDLSDFMDIDTASGLEVDHRMLAGIDLSACIKTDATERVASYDLKMAEQLLTLRKRELVNNGSIKEPQEEQQLDDEIVATLASLLSQNNFRAIEQARVSALEAWTELVSLMMTAGGLQDVQLSALALQGLHTILPRYERSVATNYDSTALLARLTLALVHPITTAISCTPEQSSTAHERLLAAVRISLKCIADSDTWLTLRDICYRTCIAVVGCLPLKGPENGKTVASSHARQLLVLVQNAGDRVLSVLAEDAFSGRGSTRVSAVLFLDALVALSQAANLSSGMLRALSKLNFVPVLIDTSIGSVASSFQAQNEELTTTLAYFHTALALLLRICSTADGTQLVLNSGFFSAISDSRLFSTDPDIGLDIDNPVALRQFYRLLSAVLRVVTAVAIARGPGNAATLQLCKSFLLQNRFSIQAVFKRTSSVQRTAGPAENEAQEVAEQFGKLMLVTGFLDDDESTQQKTLRLGGFT
ncbi:hypothetical protein LTR62_000180 [Meristemomyces frigidus]|uniref:Nucleoporin n=1 Tax=Meristemomyces frigidus TaxID=1508187 RepID=A0AAN7TS61_9PEZI|nr:hypothetical protein LTR62_000180 [Meristemomyces frigidus]